MLGLELILIGRKKWHYRYYDKLRKLLGQDDIYVWEARCKYNSLKREECLGSQKHIYWNCMNWICGIKECVVDAIILQIKMCS